MFGNFYIEGKNDIQNPKAKLSTDDNHPQLENVGQVWCLSPGALPAVCFCFSSFLKYSINQGLALRKPYIKKSLNYFSTGIKNKPDHVSRK